MGYTTDLQGRLCCDVCGEAGGVRRRRCPYGWCQATPLCATCLAKWSAAAWRQLHRGNGCERLHERAVAERVRKQELLDAGLAVRCSALNAGDLGVHVLFRYRDGRTVGRYMAPAVYEALPLLTPYTLEDYEAAAVGLGCEAPREAPGAFY